MTHVWEAGEFEIQVEQFIDRHGLMVALGVLAGVCADKAVHIEENWHDKGLARLWRRVGNRIDRVDTGGL